MHGHRYAQPPGSAIVPSPARLSRFRGTFVVSPSLRQFAQVVPGLSEACCPSCRYPRTGIALASACPECGAAGLDRSVIVLGNTRTGRLAYAILFIGSLVAASLLLGAVITESLGRAVDFGFAAYTRNFAEIPVLMKVAIICALVLLLDQVWKRVTKPPLSLATDVPPGGIAWIAHPSGIEVREPGHARWIPREAIHAVRYRRSSLGQFSRLEVVFNRRSIRGILNQTTVVYVRGSDAECDEVRRTIDAVLHPTDMASRSEAA